ncbi:MAG: hypothetical protein AAFP88_00745 [Bacteroidota bacterium]
MKKSIQHRLTYSLIISSSIFLDACKAQKPATGTPQNKRAIQSNQAETRPIIHTVDKPVTSSLGKVNLINKDQSIHPDLLAFMNLFDLKHDGTIDSVNRALQAHFLRKPGQERTDIQDDSFDASTMAQAIQLLRQMSLVDEIAYTPTQVVDYFLLFGAMTQRMTSRIQDFVKQYEKGVRCKNIILLGGVRKLREHEITFLKGLKMSFPAFLQKLGKQEKELTEADAFRAIWDTNVPTKTKVRFTEGKNLFFINSTDVTQGTNDRPTTGTTLDAWYDLCQPAPGHCHGNVELPYGIRMEKVLRTFLHKKGKGFSISWNSPAASEKLQIGVYKDTLARTFYQECKLKGYI